MTTSRPTAAARSARGSTAAAFAAQGLAYALVLTSLPTLSERHDVGTGGLTLLVLLVCAMAALGTVIASHGAEGRGGSRAALATGVGVLGLALALLAVAPGMTVLVTGLVVYGLGLGMVDAAANMQAVSVQHAYGRSVLASFHGMWSAAGVVGALLVAKTGQWGANGPVVVVLAFGVPACIAISLAVLRWGWASRPDQGAPVPADAQQHEVAAMVPWRPVLLLGLGLVAYYVVDSSVSTWSSLYLAGPLHASGGVRPLGYAAYLGATLVTRLVADRGVRRWGRAAIVHAAIALALTGLALVVLGHPLSAVIGGFALVGALGVVPPLAFSTVGDLAPGQADSVVARLNYFNYIGVVLGAGLVGAVGTWFDLRAGFLVPMLAVLAIPLISGVLRVPGVGAGGVRLAPTPHAPAPR